MGSDLDFNVLFECTPTMRAMTFFQHLQRFLVMEEESLARFTGNFTEVIFAKTVQILRKRGLVERHAFSEEYLSFLHDIIYQSRRVEDA